MVVMRRRLSDTPPPEPATDGDADPLLIDDSTCGCCCFPWRRRKASGQLHDPFLTAGEQPSLGPDAKQLGQVVREIVTTERAYVADLDLLATHFMPLLHVQLATSDRWGFRVDAKADELPQREHMHSTSHTCLSLQ